MKPALSLPPSVCSGLSLAAVSKKRYLGRVAFAISFATACAFALLALTPVASAQTTGTSLSLSGWAVIGDSSNSASSQALAIGSGNNVSSESLSLGDFTYVYSQSLAAGNSASAQYGSLAFGDLSYAEINSFALGYTSWASDTSLSVGIGTGGVNSSFSLGYLTLAQGCNSASFGDNTTASSYASVVIGRFNRVGSGYNGDSATQFQWVETEPLFVVGNGTGDSDDAVNGYRDAFVIYKNGTIRMQKAQGDISMGSFQ